MKNKIHNILFIIFLFVLISCNKENKYEIDNLNHNTIMILGHRGMGELYKYPGNTAEAILPVIGIGADGAEIDIQMTKDSVLVLYHSDLLDTRTTCTGKISEKYWYEIKDCKYNLTWALVPLCTVDSLFGLIDNINDYYFSFDIKLDGEMADNKEYKKTFLRAILAIDDKYNMSENIIIEGEKDFLLLGRSLGLTNKECVVRAGPIEKNIEYAVEYNFFCVGTETSVSESVVKDAHSKGIRIMVWNAKNNIGNLEAIDKNVDIIQTDAPIHILQQLNRYDYEYQIP